MKRIAKGYTTAALLLGMSAGMACGPMAAQYDNRDRSGYDRGLRSSHAYDDGYDRGHYHDDRYRDDHRGGIGPGKGALIGGGGGALIGGLLGGGLKGSLIGGGIGAGGGALLGKVNQNRRDDRDYREYDGHHDDRR